MREMLVKSSKYNLKCPHSMQPEYITVHNTYNDASAHNEVQYMILNQNQVSFHIAVDDKEEVLGIPLNRNAWHCGDGNGNGNRKSIGIEICYSKSGGTKYHLAEGRAIVLIAKMLKERGWGIDRVKKHQDWSGKNCPHRILDEGRWNSFLGAIKAELNKEEVKKVETIELSPNQQKDKDLLVKHGLMSANFKVQTGEMVALLTMMAGLLRKLESKGVL